MKIWKNAFTTALIAMFVLGVFAVPRAFAQINTLSAPTIEDPSLGPGSTFSIDISLTNAQRLVAFDFYLYYDANVLNATGGEGYDPFTYPLPTSIDNSIGSILVGASFPPPETRGQDFGEEPYPVMRVDFTVNAYGASMFKIVNPVFANSTAQPIPVTTANGWFRNVEGAPIAWFDPTAPTVVGTPVTFTSQSMEASTLDWDWGDGSAHGTMVTETHTWTAVGTYTVTLNATNTESGISDTQVRSIEITEPPLAGAIAVKVHVTHVLTDYTKYGDRKLNFQVWVTNLDLTRETLVRVEICIYLNLGGGKLLKGAILPDWQWIPPQTKTQFSGSMDVLDPKWGWVGSRLTAVSFTCKPQVYYADYFIGGDPNSPHWAQVPNAPEVAVDFDCSETAPTPAFTWAYDGSRTLSFNGSATIDPDIKFGDFLQYRWQIVSATEGTIGLTFGETQSWKIPSDYGSDYYRFRVRVEDMFGVRITSAYTPWVWLDVPPA